jgi:hypothetical protein
MGTYIFWSTSSSMMTFHRWFYKPHGFFQDFSGTSLAPPETHRRHRVLLTARRRGMQKEYGGELFKDWRFFLVRAGFK